MSGFSEKGAGDVFTGKNFAFIKPGKKYRLSAVDLEQLVGMKLKEMKAAFEKELTSKAARLNIAEAVSHEIRGPLSVILTSISILEKGMQKTGTNTGYQKHIDKIKLTVCGLTSLVEDFLFFEKLEQRQIELQYAEFDMKEFVENLVKENNYVFQSQQKVTMNFSGRLKVTQDKRILKYILLNLFSNAGKYSDSQGEINFSCDTASPMIKMEISDKGIGIPEKDQQQLFSAYFRANNAGKIRGTGLGLNITKRLTEIIEGNISFKSIVNQGTTFILQIPDLANTNSVSSKI